MTDCISTYKSRVAFARLAVEADKSRMNAELRVTLAEL